MLGRKACISLLVSIIIAVSVSYSVKAQGLPDDAALPAGKGAWVIDQLFHSYLVDGIASAAPNTTRVIVQSDGTVFRRQILYKFRVYDSGWCRDEFTEQEMRAIRAAVGKFRSGIWKESYGQTTKTLSPFTRLVVTTRVADGTAVDDITTVRNYDGIPADLLKLLNETDKAGNLAFSNCR